MYSRLITISSLDTILYTTTLLNYVYRSVRKQM
jgi:hypothetical protein